MRRDPIAAQKAALLEPLAEEPQEEVEYPCWDGVAFSESPAHATAKMRAAFALERHFRSRPSVLVGCDMLLYYEEGNRDASLAPDVYVSLGLGPMSNRETYRVWEEGKAPEFVLEIVSRSTAKRDIEVKPGLYAAIGVQEHWLLDPKGLRLAEPLQGSRLSGGAYKPILPVESADGRWRLPSEALGLHIGTKQVESFKVAEFWSPQSGSEVLVGSDLADAYEDRGEERDRAKEGQARAEHMLRTERAARLQAEECQRKAEHMLLAEHTARTEAEERAERAERRLSELTGRNGSNL